MVEFAITSNQILGICSFIAAVWGVWKIVREVRKPNEDLRAEVDRQKEFLHNDNVRLKELENTNKMILQSLLVLINHEITGNSTDRMKEMRNELQEFLINK